MDQLFIIAKRKQWCNLYCMRSLMSRSARPPQLPFILQLWAQWQDQQGERDVWWTAGQPTAWQHESWRHTHPQSHLSSNAGRFVFMFIVVQLMLRLWKHVCILLLSIYIFTKPCNLQMPFISSRSCGLVEVTLGSQRGRFLSVGTVRGWMWSLANTGCPSARTVKVRSQRYRSKIGMSENDSFYFAAL